MGGTTTEIKLYKSKRKALKLFLLSAPLFAGGIWMIVRDDSSQTDLIMGWIGTCLFGLAIPVGIYHLLDKRPQVVINEIGIFDRTTHEEFINWDIIKDAYPINIYGQQFVCLLVAENFKPSKKKGLLQRGFAKLNKGIGAQELNINLGQLDANSFKMTDFILAMIHADKSKRLELISAVLR